MSAHRLLAVLVTLLCGVALLAAACGGSSSSSSPTTTSGAPGGAVATVGSAKITQAQLDALMGQAEGYYKAQGQTFPASGSPDYQQLQDKALALLIQRSEYEQEAKKLGVVITPKQVNEGLAQFKKQRYGGSEQRYQDALKQQNTTDAQARDAIRRELLSNALFQKALAGATVTKAEEEAFYKQHPEQYSSPQTRAVRHILVKSKTEADKLYKELKNGAKFAALAKKYSIDPGTKNQGGKLTDTRGSFVAPFEAVAFALRTGEISKPVRSRYGWHIIQALKPATPRQVTPFAKVESQIRQQLLAPKQRQAAADWVKNVAKEFCSGKLSYAKGFLPSPDPCASVK